MRFFGLFSKSRIEILVLKRQNVENNSTKQAQKTVGLILFKKLRYLSSKVVILAKWTLWHHISSFLHDLWPLEPDERLIMMYSIHPHGYLMITRRYTINRAFNSVKMDHFRAIAPYFVIFARFMTPISVWMFNNDESQSPPWISNDNSPLYHKSRL